VIPVTITLVARADAEAYLVATHTRFVHVTEPLV
jgi:hypothetical protein